MMARRSFRARLVLLALAMQVVLVAARAPRASADEPLLEKQNLFEAAQGGYALYRIPGVVVTGRGTLLVYCEARKNAGGDWGHIDVLLRRSGDGGKTWSEPRNMAKRPADATRNPAAAAQKLGREGEITLNNPVAIADPRSGAVHFLYCVEYGRCFYMRSDDDGLTFSEPVEITSAFDKFRPEYDWKVLATGPGHGIALRNGRLLVPVWLSTATGGHAHRPSCASVLYSDDEGKTWERGQVVVAHSELGNPSETAAVELSDGRVMLNIRHESPSRRRAVAESPNGATDYGPIRLDDALPEPVCMGSIARLATPDGGKPYILFANPHNPVDRARKNVTVKLSEDDGKTWPVARSLEPGPSGYSDLATSPDGTIWCFYERGGESPGNHYQLKYLCLAKFNLAWLRGGN
jgi:sialidase-1